MTTRTSIPSRYSGKIRYTKVLLSCGILSSLLYVSMNIFIPMYYPGYNSLSQTVSELSAIGAPTRLMWVISGTLYTFLIVAFGWGVWNSSTRNRKLTVVGSLIILYGLLGIGWPLAPMHQREVLAAGGGTISDTMHIVFSIVTSLLMLLAMGYGATAFGRRFKFYSIITILVLLIFGAMTASDAPRLESNLPTPMLGIWERIMIGAFMLWVIVIAVLLLRKEKKQFQSKDNPVKKIRSHHKSVIAHH